MRIVVLFVFFCLSVLTLQAQRFSYAFNRITTEDGLGLQSNVIYSIYQDSRGFIWVGSSNGVQRFDGGKFVTFDPDGTKGDPLPSVAVNQVLRADSSSMWLAAYSIHQVGIFNPSTYTYRVVPLKTAKPLPARSEFRMWQDSYGNTYVNVHHYGKILKYDKVLDAFTENTPLNNLPKNWKATFNALHDKAKKQYWIVSDSGLCVYDEVTKQMWSRLYNPANLALLNNHAVQKNVSDIYIDKERRHWVFNWGNDQHFYCFDATGKYPLNDTAGLNGVNTSYAELRSFYETSNGTLWIYGLANLYALEKGENAMNKGFQLYRTQYLDNYGIRYGSVNQLYEDRDGVLWIATDQGLYYTSSFSADVINMYLSNIPGYYSVTDLVELQNGDYWLSTWGKGVITLSKNFKPYPTPLYKAMPSMDAVAQNGYKLTWSMCQQKKTGKVFIGCQSGYMMIYDPATGKTEYQRPPVFDERTIRYIVEDKQNNLWFGTQAGRIVKYDGKDYKIILDLGVGAIIYKILIDSRGWAWVATHDKGVYAINGATGKVEQHYTADESNAALFANTCRDLEQLNDSIIYASTEALNIINTKTKTVRQVTSRDGLPSNSIKRLRLDWSGYLWIITDKGLARYDHKRERFTNYGRKDGVMLGESADKADFICSEGYLMFTGINSLLFFKPDAFKRSTPPPDVILTDFLLGSEYQLLDSLQQLPEVRLQPHQNNFMISFACLDFKNREKFIYYYKMEGLHKDWIRADRLSVPFTAMSPGHYTFQVKAESLDGLMSKNISTLKIFVKPPFWQTKWFISLLLLIVALVAYSMHRLRLHRYFAVEKIRNRVARDLHDDMGSTLSTINILSSMAKAKLNTDTMKTAEYINKISDNSQRMMEAMDDIVWAIKPANDTMQKVVARMREFATNVFEAKDIELEFKAGEEVNDAKIDMEGRRDFFLIFKEAVNNAAKYSKCTKATVHVFVEHRTLVLLVKDNGVGFDVKTADSGNGLGNMQKRSDALRGKLLLLSKEGEGTEVRLTVPLN
ncbi:MAG: hypothetical protein GXC73_05135 [Chitinophagaceae bacterium]|nr:hypothetical protein [Chitinophagaceae bacterium]